MENYIRPSQLYAWTLNNLHKLPADEQERTLENMKSLEWIKDTIEGLNSFQREILKHTLMINIDNPEMAFDLMSISVIIYNLNLAGVDISDLENKVNSSQRVINEIESMFHQLN